jgi:hypothetical protein
MAHENDPEEFVGADKSVRAEPVKTTRKPAAPLTARVKPNGEPMASHPKHAVAGPAKAYEAAKAETEAARIDYRVATDAFKSAEKAEGAAVADWIKLNPSPSQDEVLRENAKRSLEQRAANVANGLPPQGIKTLSHGNSVVDRQAAQRPRQTPQMASAPLRSPVSRRVL